MSIIALARPASSPGVLQSDPPVHIVVKRRHGVPLLLGLEHGEVAALADAPPLRVVEAE